MKNGIVGGLVAGVVFMILEMLLVPLVGGGSAFGPPRMIAAIVMGEGVLPPPATFDASIFLVAMLVHFGLSMVLGIIFAVIFARRALSETAFIGIGAAFGLAVYFVHFYGLTAIFPWFEMARNWISIFAHIVFGAVLGWWVARHRAVAIVH